MKLRIKTLEGKSKTKNGIKRLLLCGIAIIMEFVFIFFMMTKLYNYADYISAAIRLAAVILVLGIYSQYKTSSLKMPWIVLILALPLFGVVLYLLIGLSGRGGGTKKMRLRYAKVDQVLFPELHNDSDTFEGMRSEYPGASTISKYISSYSMFPVYKNTDVTYFDSGAKGFEAQLEAISHAKSFIFMEYFAIEDAESWAKVQDILEKKVKEGVKVRVFYDDLGSIVFINHDFAEKLKKVGIECRIFNPVGPGLNFFLNYRDHRKITIVDGKVAFTGGYNMANEYFNITHPFGDWKDSGVRLEGDAVRSLTVMFLEMWNAVKEKDISDSSFENFLIDYDYKAKEKGYVQPYADSPLDNEPVGESVYISLINKAEKYCWFMTPYLIITDEMRHALVMAGKRGVDVRIITPGIPDKKIVYSVTRSFYHALAKDGVRIYEWTPGFCHSKLCIVDDYMATCGSINLDYRSLYHHFEDGCFMVNCDAIADIKADFLNTFPECEEVSEKYKSGRKAGIRFEQLLLRLFAELM